MGSTYRGSYVGIRKILTMPSVAVAVEVAAATMLPIAEALSPEGDPSTDRHAGLYRGSWVVVRGTKSVRYRGRPTKRPYGRLLNTTAYARQVEYGTGRVPRYAVARRTMDAAVSRGG